MHSTGGEPKAPPGPEELPEGSAALLSCWQLCFLPGLMSLFGCNLSQGVCGDGPGQGGAVGTQRLHSRPSHCSSFTRDEYPGSSLTGGKKQLCPCGRAPWCHPACRGQPGESRASRRSGCGRAGRQHTVPTGSEPMPPAWPRRGSSCAQHHEHRAAACPGWWPCGRWPLGSASCCEELSCGVQMCELMSQLIWLSFSFPALRPAQRHHSCGPWGRDSRVRGCEAAGAGQQRGTDAAPVPGLRAWWRGRSFLAPHLPQPRSVHSKLLARRQNNLPPVPLLPLAWHRSPWSQGKEEPQMFSFQILPSEGLRVSCVLSQSLI